MALNRVDAALDMLHHPHHPCHHHRITQHTAIQVPTQVRIAVNQPGEQEAAVREWVLEGEEEEAGPLSERESGDFGSPLSPSPLQVGVGEPEAMGDLRTTQKQAQQVRQGHAGRMDGSIAPMKLSELSVADTPHSNDTKAPHSADMHAASAHSTGPSSTALTPVQAETDSTPSKTPNIKLKWTGGYLGRSPALEDHDKVSQDHDSGFPSPSLSEGELVPDQANQGNNSSEEGLLHSTAETLATLSSSVMETVESEHALQDSKQMLIKMQQAKERLNLAVNSPEQDKDEVKMEVSEAARRAAFLSKAKSLSSLASKKVCAGLSATPLCTTFMISFMMFLCTF